MDSGAVSRTSLPPIQFLESDKLRRDEMDYQTRHGETPTSATATSNTSAIPYPSGPPPPYSAATQPNIQPRSSRITAQTPEMAAKQQESRDTATHAAIQSLPSLSEALGGVDRKPAYPQDPIESATLKTSRPAPPAHPIQSPTQPSAGSSPAHRSHSFGPIQTHRSEYPHAQHTYPEASELRRREYVETHKPPFQHRSPVMSAPRHSRPSFSESNRHFETSPQGHGPTTQFSFGYTQPPTAYSSAPSAPAPTTAPIYQPSLSHASPESSHNWRPGAAAVNATQSRPPQAYSESVKRHLDFYDFELALNEISEHSTIMLDFSRQYGARLHQMQRSGVTPGSLPAITEVEDLMNKSRHTLDALGRLRDVLVTQQAAYFQQAQEQHLRRDQDLKRNDSIHQQDETKQGGFAGAEPKKRRGRNAAPGRCHSCNRAETPEWRRGPDGARTLCNACGLHYAKLTRKAGASKAAIGSSSLRPKGNDDGSDT